MPLGLLLDFVVIIVFVFVVSTLVLLLTIRPPASDSMEADPDLAEPDQSPEYALLEEVVEQISQDEELLETLSPANVPHIDLPGASLGGGAVEEAFSKVAGNIALHGKTDPNDRREYNRRLGDRRVSDAPVDDDQRMVQRRVWLRREEDCRGKQLLSVTDAADTLGVPVEQIYKWLDESDIPFYQVTENKKRAIRFDVSELLQWHSTFLSSRPDDE